jgi:hypothetical protein
MSEEVVKQEGDFKIKKKPSMKKLGKTPEVSKINLSSGKKIEDSETTVLKVEQEKPDLVKEVEHEKPEDSVIKDEEVVTIQEVSEEDEVEAVSKEMEEAVLDSNITGKALPENVEKLVSFMEDTGGTIDDYVRLNADYSSVDNNTLLKEYYKKSKPHLDSEEIDFLLEDSFSYDEELDEERDVRKRKLAFKEEVQKAKNFLEDLKGKYYDEIKLRPGVTQEQKKATDFFNKYNEEKSLNSQKHDRFKKSTSDLFNNDFKGFDFNVGEKKFRYGVNNPTSLAEKQSDVSNILGKFLGKNGEVTDHKGYHKAMYAASNVDKIASHFYEQGKADAVKEVMSSSKNISDEPRRASGDSVFVNGIKVKSISGVDSSKLKIKTKN